MKDVVDRDLEKAEYEATRTWSRTSKEQRLSAEAEASRRRTSEAGSAGSAASVSSSDASTIEDYRPRARRAPTERSLGRTTTGTHPLELQRTETHRLQQTATVGGGVSTHTRESRRPMPPMGGGKPYPPPLPERDEYLVEFEGPDDPLHPQNWKLGKK